MVYRRSHSILPDRGVSPVVGVILMVAVTVVLAALVGEFVLNLSEILQEPPQAGVTVSESYDEFNDVYTVTVMATSMPNADEIIVRCSSDCEGGGLASISEVGETASVKTGSNGKVVIIGALGDNNQQVLKTYETGG